MYSIHFGSAPVPFPACSGPVLVGGSIVFPPNNNNTPMTGLDAVKDWLAHAPITPLASHAPNAHASIPQRAATILNAPFETLANNPNNGLVLDSNSPISSFLKILFPPLPESSLCNINDLNTLSFVRSSSDCSVGSASSGISNSTNTLSTFPSNYNYNINGTLCNCNINIMRSCSNASNTSNVSSTSSSSSSSSSSDSISSFGGFGNVRGQNENKQSVSLIKKDVVFTHVHYLWACNIWTHLHQDVTNFDATMPVTPNMVVIEVNNLDNFNKLSNPSLCESKNEMNASSIGSLGTRTNQLLSFKNYVFFSNPKTSDLQRKLGKLSNLFEFQALYQFEARKFQYSLLTGNIRIVKDYRGLKKLNGIYNKSHLEYLIFKFGLGTNGNELYAICDRNDRLPLKQAWCCKYIKTLNEMIDFFGLNNIPNDAKVKFLESLKISDNVVTERFDTNLTYSTNTSKILRMLKHAFIEFEKASERRSFSKNAKNATKGKKGNNKLKNEDKFNYLQFVANEMNIDALKLIELVGDAIENAFEFTMRHPETALTQAYLDEERGNINFELVLEAEIPSINKHGQNRYYKFGIPIVKCQNKNTKAFYYEARNILTPKMAMDNVRLNSKNAQLDNNTFIANLDDFTFSFYEKIETTYWMKNENYETSFKDDSVSILSKVSESNESRFTFDTKSEKYDSDNEKLPASFGTLKRRSINASDDDN